MRTSLLSLALLASAVTVAAPVVAQAQAAAKYNADSDLGTLADNPKTKAVLDKHLPGFSSNPQFDQARSLSLRAIAGYAPENFPEQKIKDIEADLAKVTD